MEVGTGSLLARVHFGSASGLVLEGAKSVGIGRASVRQSGPVAWLAGKKLPDSCRPCARNTQACTLGRRGNSAMCREDTPGAPCSTGGHFWREAEHAKKETSHYSRWLTVRCAPSHDSSIALVTGPKRIFGTSVSILAAIRKTCFCKGRPTRPVC